MSARLKFTVMSATEIMIRLRVPVMPLLTGLLFAAVHSAATCVAQPAGSTMYYEGRLSIPAVARFRQLPLRLFLRSEFDLPTADRYFPEEYLPRFLQIMQGDFDNELKYHVARALERIVRERLTSIDAILPVVRTTLQQSDDLNVRRACAMVLTAADTQEHAAVLSELCRAGDLHASLLIEPKLADWKSNELTTEWLNRIRQPEQHSRVLIGLACNGLSRLANTDALPELAGLAESDTTRFQIRKAAAAAVSRLSAEQAVDIATRLADGSLEDRITAVTLLQAAAGEPGLKLLSSLCDDDTGTVAALAWDALFRQDPQRLTDRLQDASRHAEANVRRTVIRTCAALPTAERCDLLNQMMADRNLYVRNHAREALIKLAESNADLKAGILANAGDVTAQTDAAWEQLEQAMVLLSVLRHDQYQPNSIALMKHARPEVYVTAAWMLHLMPRNELSGPAVAQAAATWEKMQDTKLPQPEIDALSLQLGFLFHVAGFCGDNGLREVMELQFDKSVPTAVPSRASAMWALGMLAEGSEDADLQSRFVERIFDDNPIDPEAFEVRAGSALALGLLGSRTAIDDLRRALNNYGYGSELSKAAATALVQLGEERPVFPDIPPEPLSGWPIRIPQ